MSNINKIIESWYKVFKDRYAFLDHIKEPKRTELAIKGMIRELVNYSKLM